MTVAEDPGLPGSTPCGHAFLCSVDRKGFKDRDGRYGFISPDTDNNRFLVSDTAKITDNL